jgi:hypothetical protein
MLWWSAHRAQRVSVSACCWVQLGRKAATGSPAVMFYRQDAVADAVAGLRAVLPAHRLFLHNHRALISPKRHLSSISFYLLPLCIGFSCAPLSRAWPDTWACTELAACLRSAAPNRSPHSSWSVLPAVEALQQRTLAVVHRAVCRCLRELPQPASWRSAGGRPRPPACCWKAIHLAATWDGISMERISRDNVDALHRTLRQLWRACEGLGCPAAAREPRCCQCLLG